MAQPPRALELLQALVDQDEDSELRFLVDGKHIKYITIGPGVFTNDEMCFGPDITRLLPALPTGDWNYGYVTLDSQTSQPHFAQAIKKEMEGIENLWHPTTVDYLELAIGHKMRSGVYEVASPKFPTTVVLKFATFEHEIHYLDGETAVYEWIEGQGVGPKFLGHVSEEGRVIGSLVEKIEHARHAKIFDHAACAKALADLHRLGLLHGDTNKHNFLINSVGVTLIDFDTTRECDDPEAFKAEMEGLTAQLNEHTGRGGSIVDGVIQD